MITDAVIIQESENPLLRELPQLSGRGVDGKYVVAEERREKRWRKEEIREDVERMKEGKGDRIR